MKSWMNGAPFALVLALAAPVAYAEDVTMAELPGPVRETYEIEFRENNRKFELDVSPEGQVLRRHAD